MKQNVIVMSTAIVCLTTLELFAMYKELDGYLFSLIVMAIAGVAGFKMPDIIKRLTKKKQKSEQTKKAQTNKMLAVRWAGSQVL